jgi:Ala-tRNA(Pro) deacylase
MSAPADLSSDPLPPGSGQPTPDDLPRSAPSGGTSTPGAGPDSGSDGAPHCGPATPDDLFAALDRLGIAHPAVSHRALFTVDEAQALRGTIPGGHTKNLFLKDKKGALFLVTAPEDAAIALKSLHRTLGASGRFSFGSPEQLRQALGVEPGSVTPLAAINDTGGRVTVVLDRALLEHEVINCHPLVNTMTVSLRRDDLLAFLRSTGHEPVVTAVSGPDDAD